MDNWKETKRSGRGREGGGKERNLVGSKQVEVVDCQADEGEGSCSLSGGRQSEAEEVEANLKGEDSVELCGNEAVGIAEGHGARDGCLEKL